MIGDVVVNWLSKLSIWLSNLSIVLDVVAIVLNTVIIIHLVSWFKKKNGKTENS